MPRPPRSHAGGAILITTVLALAACGVTDPSSEASSMTDADLSLSSAAFSEGAAIPARFSCDGEDISPPLAWSGAPAETTAYALIVDDPDARGFVHWAVADIPASASGVPEGDAAGGVEGRNDFGRDGYGGPCPPSGTHRYAFTLVALASATGLAPGFSADDLRDAVADRTLASTTLTGTYARGGS